MIPQSPLSWTSPASEPLQVRSGLRFGDKGTHSCRTMMLAELSDLLAAVPADAARVAYAEAIINDNVLGKTTTSSRRLTNQRLAEVYALDRTVPIFRVLRRLFDHDPDGRPLIVLLCALARDPLLRATAPAILALAPGEELRRQSISNVLRLTVGDRLNESSLDKVVRNTSSSWSQSGHLEGRVRKVRRLVAPTPGAVAFALWLGFLQGFAGEDLLSSAWVRVLDLASTNALDLTLRAKQQGLVSARAGGSIVEIDPSVLDPRKESR